MGNCINVLDKDGNLIGQATHGLTCACYVASIVRKYNPSYDMFSIENINEQLQPAYDNGSPEDIIILRIFINDESDFEESDIPSFEKAIEKLDPKNKIHENIKMHLTAYMKVIEEHKFMSTNYVDNCVRFYREILGYISCKCSQIPGNRIHVLRNAGYGILVACQYV